MSRFLIAIILAVACVVPAAGQTTPAKPMTAQAGPVGTYAIVTLTITFNADGTVVFQQVAPMLVPIGVPVPPGPNPPPVADLRAKLAAEVAKVTAADRVTTASTLNQALAATVAAAKSGTVSQSQVSMVLALLGPTMPNWTSFISVLNDAAKLTTTPAALGDVLQVAVDVLGTVK